MNGDPALSFNTQQIAQEAIDRLYAFGLHFGEKGTHTSRTIMLAELTGAHLHVGHLSTRQGIRLVQEAKARGLHVTCEVTPHHFTLTDEAVGDYNTNCKVCPPLRGTEDVAAIRDALTKGGIIEDSQINATRNLGRIDAYQIVGRQRTTRVQFGNQIDKVNVRHAVDNMIMSTGKLNSFVTGSDISYSNIGVAGTRGHPLLSGEATLGINIAPLEAARFDNSSTGRIKPSPSGTHTSTPSPASSRTSRLACSSSLART